MTFDLTKPADGLTVEERLALLEARLAPAPQVVVPPITVGSLTNVPVPGGQIAAQWAQDVSSIALHRFASKASLDAWAAPVGARAVTTDNNLEWRRVAGGWSLVTPWTAAIGGITTTAPGTTTLATITVPADPGPRIITASCFLRVDKYTPANVIPVNLVINESIQARTDIPKLGLDLAGGGLQVPFYVSMDATNYPAPPSGCTVRMDITTPSAGTSGEWSLHGESYWNRLDVTVAPRGY